MISLYCFFQVSPIEREWCLIVSINGVWTTVNAITALSGHPVWKVKEKYIKPLFPLFYELDRLNSCKGKKANRTHHFIYENMWCNNG